ncbi:MAG: hypothetical protein ABJE95_12680 [Byssovorax sp.]
MLYRFTSRLPCWPLLLALAAAPLVACGGGATGGAGGSTGSSSAATGTGGAGGEVPQARVILRDHAGHPAVGVDVLVHDVGGLTTQKTTTDKTGAADVDLVAGGGVTALWKASHDGGDPEWTAVSALGLAAGSEVRLVADVAGNSLPPASASLSFTGVAPLQSSQWDIVVSCSVETTTGEILFSYEGCRDSATYDLVAFLAPGDKRIVFPAQTKQPGAMIHFSLDPANAEAAPPVLVDVTGVPDGTPGLLATLSAYRPEGGLTRYTTTKSLTIPQDTELSLSRLIVAASGSFELDIGTTTATGGSHSRLYFQDNALPLGPVPWSVPPVVAIAKIGTLTGTVARPSIPWELVPGGEPSDAVRVVIGYQATDPAPSMGTMHGARWTLYTASAGAGVTRLPEIPATFPGFAPEGPLLDVRAEHVDVPAKVSLISAVNADFDRVPVSWSSTVATLPPMP